MQTMYGQAMVEAYIKKDSIILNLQNVSVIDDILSTWRHCNLPSNICYDIFLSLITILNKGTVGPYNGHIDISNDTISANVPIQHQYKALYKKELPDDLKHLVDK